MVLSSFFNHRRHPYFFCLLCLDVLRESAQNTIQIESLFHWASFCCELQISENLLCQQLCITLGWRPKSFLELILYRLQSLEHWRSLRRDGCIGYYFLEEINGLLCSFSTVGIMSMKQSSHIKDAMDRCSRNKFI